MYKIVGASALILIIALGIYFNWPRTQNVINGVGASINTQQNIPPPDLQSISGFINTAPIYHLSQEKNQVVLLHFWRYGCQECQQEMSFINYLYSKYHKFGLVILGIHSPEFDAEKMYSNIKQAVEAYQIKYPVLIDNTRQTWNAYGDGFWPRDALIGKTGFERYTHIGSGDQQTLEQNIQYLLAAKNWTK